MKEMSIYGPKKTNIIAFITNVYEYKLNGRMAVKKDLVNQSESRGG